MLNNLRGAPLIWAITLSSGSCYLLFGYDQVRKSRSGSRSFPRIFLTIRQKGVLGGLVSQPSFLDAIGNPNASYLGTIVALYNIGCLVGCMLAAIWGNDWGRKKTIMIGNGIMIIGAVIQAATYGAPQLIAGRLISGFGNGLLPSVFASRLRG